VALKRNWLFSVLALKNVSFSLADVQNDVSLPLRIHTTTFSTDQQLRRFVICLTMCEHFNATSTMTLLAVYNVNNYIKLY